MRFSFLAGTALLTGCSKSDDVVPRQLVASNSGNALAKPPTDCTLYTPEAMVNNYVSKSAKDLAKILSQNSAARTVLGAEVGKRIDGDYDALYSTLKTKAVGTTTFQALLDQTRATDGGWGVIPLPTGSDYNRLIVSIPVNFEMWSTTATPLVAFVPYAFNDQVHTTIQAYNAQGGLVTLSTLTDPTKPVVVISLGERIAADGTVRPAFLSPTSSGRPIGAAEYLTGIRCDKLSAYEPWVRGAPELKLYIGSARLNVISTATPTVTTEKLVDGHMFSPDKRKTVSETIWPRNFFIFTWTSNYADYYTMQWMEEDGGPTVTFTMEVKPEFGDVKAGTFGTKIDFSKFEEDDNIGSRQIYRYDPTGELPFGNVFTAIVESRP